MNTCENERAARPYHRNLIYPWLEQGSGGRPSAAVLDQLVHTLMLTEAEREYVFTRSRS
ncbi:hypothetical protein [Sodalis-like endosymbiont of Proechinophthirus fluctus]|uniref:hypothetical protein n=1 Tax=Sodalis-like endosymbiont of Proechinophthirus fluctus TaxID=1462730 RepID=UPI000A6CA233|nr:hypothetical protein [Sodalis-like endosymbiont of Proechinophthirus fluctus]